MKTNFLGSAYTLRSLPLAAQTCINLYTEANESQNGSVGAFYGAPGLDKLHTFAGAVRGLQVSVDGDWLYVVAGSEVWKSNKAWVWSKVGDLTTSDGPVQIANNATQTAIAHAGGWSVIKADGTLVVVADAPTTVDLSFIDNYGVCANENGTYGWTKVADFTVTDALDFASAEGQPDRIIRTLSDHRELWLFGTDTTEIAVVSSDPDLPFTRTAFIEQGILAPLSAIKQDNSVFWLGKNESGSGCIYRANGYTPTRISTHAIEQWIRKCARPEYARAYTYQQEGHHFYVLSFDEGTWCYDLNTGEWTQRAYRNPDTGALQRHRSDCHAFFAGKHIVGDYEDGRLYEMRLDVGTDDGAPIYRERAFPLSDAEGRLIQMVRGELLADMGEGVDGAATPDDADPQVWLSVSKDGCRTWSSERQKSLGKTGEYTRRAQWFALGSGRQLAIKLRTTTARPVVWRGFNLDGHTAER